MPSVGSISSSQARTDSPRRATFPRLRSFSRGSAMMLNRSAHTVIVSMMAAAAAYAAVAGNPLRADTSPELDAIKRLTWRSIGPANQAGRISVIVGIPGDPSTFFVSGANGGIFKTTNTGITFHPVFEDKPVVSIGAIAIAPSNPNIVYVGTGEENPRNNA